MAAPHSAPNAPSSLDPPSPRQVSWWLLEWLKPKPHHTTAATFPSVPVSHRPDRRRLIQALCERCPAIQHAQRLGNAFIALVREHHPQDLDAWISTVLASGLGELIGFASGLLADQAAVIAALSLPWSNGQTEGQINRLKVIKRQMYGRAKLDLLKVRVLHPP